MNNNFEVFEKTRQSLIKKSILRNPNTDPELCLFTPAQTLFALKNHPKIINWHNYLLNHYFPEKKEVLLLFPCAANKPWIEGKTKSKNYQILYKLLNSHNLRKKVSLHTISEPLAIIGESDYNKMPMYDNPGLFHWFTKKYNLKWDHQSYIACINYLGLVIGKFLNKSHNYFEKIFAFVKPNSNHDKMLKIAMNTFELDIIIKPTNGEIGNIKNNYVWMSNNNVQESFIRNMNYILNVVE